MLDKKIEFIELGCARKAADIVQPFIDEGKAGLFVDANQAFLIERFKTLWPQNYHIFVCGVVDTINHFTPFFLTDRDYSSCSAKHVLEHVSLNYINTDLSKEERHYNVEDIAQITFSTITLNDILRFVGGLNGTDKLSLLSIDCEGLDCQLILSADFSIIRPQIINFEHSHSERPFCGEGENYNKALAHLATLGYKVKEKGANDTIVKLQTI